MNIRECDVHIIGGPAGLDSVIARLMPGEAADHAVRSNADRASWSGLDVAFDVGIGHSNDVRSSSRGGDVAVVLRRKRIVEAVRAVLWISRVEAVGLNIISVHVDALFGHH